MATTDRYREGFGERLGRVRRRLRDFIATNLGATNPGDPSSVTASSSPKVGPPTLWLHAVSVGEVLAATRLVSELEATGFRIVISTTTRTGQHLARARFGADRVFYFPFDFAFAIRPYLNLLQPQALVLMESELWPRLLHECALRSIPVVVANARVGDRSFARSMRFRTLWQRMARHVTLWLAQSDEDARRLATLLATPNSVISTEGARAPETSTGFEEASGFEGAGLQSRHPATPTSGALAPEGMPPGLKPTPLPPIMDGLKPVPFKAGLQSIRPHIRITGNLKYDILSSQQSSIAELIREAAAGRPIIVAGSTVDRLNNNDLDENEMLIQSWEGKLREQGTLLVLAPRHPEMFDLVYSVAMEFPTVRASQMPCAPNSTQPPPSIVILDTIGDLACVYSIANVAFVGGSLVPRGGHNPLEPAQFGVPVVMGTSFENFRDIVTKMDRANSIRIVQNKDELAATLEALLTNPDAARALGERGRQVFLQQQGATARSVDAILAMLNEVDRA